jgi:hypothetical protein
VGLGVLDQVGALGEGLAADGAHERSGTGVHPDVVRQVCRRDEPYKIRASKHIQYGNTPTFFQIIGNPNYLKTQKAGSVNYLKFI